MSPERKVRDLNLVIETVIYLQTEARRIARTECQRVGISPTQLNVLKLLDEIGELSLSELSKKIASQSSTVTGIVDRMVQADLVTREQSDTDRRVWRIRMTDKGAAIARKVQIQPWELLHRALEALTESEKNALEAILSKLAAFVASGAATEKRSDTSKAR